MVMPISRASDLMLVTTARSFGLVSMLAMKSPRS